MSDGGLCLAPEKRTLLRLRGPDAVRFLNGQISQEVRGLDEVRAVPACVTDAKGRLQHYVHVFQEEDDLLVEGPYEGREDLLARLERYLIADDAEILDESDGWELWHFLGEKPDGARVREAARIATGGWDLWLPAGERGAEFFMDNAAAEDSRIRHRVPAWGKELTAGLLPPEAGLDRMAISYRKGCYIGQEVLSRIKTAGKLNRKLAALMVEDGVTAGQEIGHGGIVTSVSSRADDEWFPALGYVAKADFEAGELMAAGGARVRIAGWV